MSAPDPTSHSFAHNPQKPDLQESDVDVSKPRPPQPASRYTDILARHSVQVLQEEKGFTMSVLKVADLALDPALHRATRGDREIDLTEDQVSILHFLMQRAETKVYPEELLHLRKLGPETDRSVVENEICMLKTKIDLPGEIQLIHKCGPLYQFGGSPPPQTAADLPKALSDELDALFERMQTPEARVALNTAYNASPDQMGKAAVAAARKRD